MKKYITYFLIIFIIIGIVYFYIKKTEPIEKEINFSNEIVEETIKPEIIVYKNDDMGYEIEILSDMVIDNYLEGIVTNISNKEISVSIFYDEFKDGLNNYNTYINYSNNFIKDNKNHKLIEEKNIKINNKPTHFLAYSRDKLSKLENDKNYYCSAEIKLDNNKVYTLLGKTNNEDLSMLKSILNSFKINFEPKIKEIEDGYFKNKEEYENEQVQNLYNKYFSEDSKLTWGIFEPEAPLDFKTLDKIEEVVEYDFKFLLRYQDFNIDVPMKEIENAKERNKVVVLSPQTINTKPGEIDIYEILDGKYDEHLNKYANDIKALNTPVLLRLNNEMNGDWCQYCAYYYGKDAELYRECWKYIYKIFEKNEVSNVLWVWNPNHKSFPNFSWNRDLMYYPGDEYVDIVGLTAYNTGNYYEGESWNSFDELYLEYYKEYERIFDKPLMITEFGSSIFGGDKVKWVEDMFKSLEKYPGIKVAVWWNGIDFDVNKNEARVYKIDRPKEVLEIFKKYISQK